MRPVEEPHLLALLVQLRVDQGRDVLDDLQADVLRQRPPLAELVSHLVRIVWSEKSIGISVCSIARGRNLEVNER